MTLKEIRDRLLEITEVSADPEAAHSCEDVLYEDFIRFISTSERVPAAIKEMAQAVLKTKDVNFPRWTA